MNIGAVLFALGNLALILAGALMAPLAVSIGTQSGAPWESPESLSFIVTAAIALSAGVGLRFLFRASEADVKVREGFAIVCFAWLLFTLLGMLPYLFGGVPMSLTDAFFETMSGFTTTGATIFPNVEILPAGLQFWRCMTQWLGGMGIVVLSVALLPILGVGGYRLLKAETPGGVAYERDRARIADSAKDMWQLYVFLSVVLAVLLMLGGMTPYDAICHSFTTMSTGGFSPHNESIAYFQSAYLQWVLIFFMFLAGANFTGHAHLLRGRFRRVISNVEYRTYCFILAAAIGTGVVVESTGLDFEKTLRDVAFQVVSIATTTGYITYDYEQWTALMHFTLLGLMFVGGCMGSTAGGMKVTRILVYSKTVGRELHRMIFPHGIRPLKLGQRVLEPNVAANIMAFGSLFTFAFLTGTAIMVAYDYEIVTAMSASISALGNIGPGLGDVGPTNNWGHLPNPVKWSMSFLMLLGRLELFSVIILFTPWVWRR